MTWSTLFCEIMCIHPGMSIKHDFIWSTTYCVPACYVHSIALCATGGLSTGIPLVSVSTQFLNCSPGDDQGLGAYCPQYVLTIFLFAWFRSVKYVLQLYDPWAKFAYLHFIYSLCTLHDYECNQIVFNLSTSKSIFILNITSSFYQYRYFSIHFQLFFSSLLLAELSNSPCTLHHSRF